VETKFFDGMAGNIAGIDARLSPDLKAADLAQFLADRKPLPRVAIRHTVGLDDTVEGEGGVADARENAGARYFKLKLSGDPTADAARLARIGMEPDTLRPDYKVTRASKWSAGGARFFVTGEDLTCQAGLALQQDLALGAFIGITHAERNGHHYVDGFGDTPASEAQAFAAAHPDLYADAGQGIRLS